MTKVLLKLILDPYDNENIHNRWHPDIPMAATVNQISF